MTVHTQKTKAIFMDKALAQAERALKKNEVPVGVVIVNAQGEIIARAYNKVESLGTQLAHAEALAIRKACRKIGDWRLNGCWIYVTLEPCLMCFGLIHLSRMKGIVYGAKSTLFGIDLENTKSLSFYTKSLSIEGGVKKDECLSVLRRFFKSARTVKKNLRQGKEKGSL